MVLLLLFIVVLILAIIFASTYIPSVNDFVSRVGQGQWFVVGAERDGDVLNINVSAESDKTDSVPSQPTPPSASSASPSDDITSKTCFPPTGTDDVACSQTTSSIVRPSKSSAFDPVEMSSSQGQVVNSPEVFLVEDNIYTYDEAEPLCKAYGARLATMGDLYDAWKKGADWCSYGWVKGHRAVFPTQKMSWLKLQENEESRLKCGMPGLNGGLVRDKSARYGVHCYGVKPPTWQAYAGNRMAKENLTAIEQEMNSRANYFRKRLNRFTIMPFSGGKWSTQYGTDFDK
jgi:hypothetical protein